MHAEHVRHGKLDLLAVGGEGYSKYKFDPFTLMRHRNVMFDKREHETKYSFIMD